MSNAMGQQAGAALLALATALATPALAQAEGATATYLRGGSLVEVESGRRVANPLVTISEGRIVAVEANGTAPAGAEVIDWSGHTLLPGLIDMHVHLDGRPEIRGYEALGYPDRFGAVIAGVNAGRMLRAGFTTVRDLGSGDYNTIGLDRAIEDGWLEGPRIVSAAHPLGATGGHCDSTFLPPSLNVSGPGVGDGPDEMRHNVREQRKYGAEVIKACATGGVFSRNTEPGQQQLTQAELDAIADEAARWGLRTAAHAHGAEGIKAAIRAGFTTVEHVSLVDDEGIAMAKERGTFFSMDIFNTEWTLANGERFGVLPENIRKEREVGQRQRDSFRRAHQAGVRMVFGSDAGVMPHEDVGGQFRVMVQYGMTPLEAIRAGTLNAAEALGQSGQVGTLAIGAHADIIAVAGDPLADVGELADVDHVMKGGVVVE